MFGFVKRNTLLFKDPCSRLSVYSAFVRSRVEYASFIWNPRLLRFGVQIQERAMPTLTAQNCGSYSFDAR